MTIYLLALLIGIAAGLRVVTPLAILAWGVFLGWITLGATWAAFMGAPVTVVIFTLVALAEPIAGQLPGAPSRKSPLQFGGRIAAGAFTGAVLATPEGSWVAGSIAGAIGAVIGTFAGFEGRGRLARAFGGRDLPASLIEDLVAIGLAVAVVLAA